jgi:hypothetical protein
MIHASVVENLTPIGVTPKNSCTIVQTPPRPCVTRYLRAIGALALECADQPELLSDFVAVLRLAPRTIEGLERVRRRAA